MLFLHTVIMLLVVFGTAMFIGIFNDKETLTGYSFMGFLFTTLAYGVITGFDVIAKVLG
jgi:hypothetical protein